MQYEIIAVEGKICGGGVLLQSCCVELYLDSAERKRIRGFEVRSFCVCVMTDREGPLRSPDRFSNLLTILYEDPRIIETFRLHDF